MGDIFNFRFQLYDAFEYCFPRKINISLYALCIVDAVTLIYPNNCDHCYGYILHTTVQYTGYTLQSLVE